MDDILCCPICGDTLRSKKLGDIRLHIIGKDGKYIEKICPDPMDHSIRLFTNEATRQIDFMKFSLNPKCSRFMEVDFINQKCRLACYKNNKPEYLSIPKMLDLDFPDLKKLKEKVSTYVVFL